MAKIRDGSYNDLGEVNILAMMPPNYCRLPPCVELCMVLVVTLASSHHRMRKGYRTA